MYHIRCSIAAVVLFIAFVCASYDEKLSLTPLPNGHLHTNFNFNLTSSDFPNHDLDQQENSASIISNFNIFPNSIINLITQTDTKNLSIRFTSGYWNSESWGKLPSDGYTSGGNGLELWATIKANSKEEAYKKWTFLVNSLSGFFCASLNFIDETRTTYPEHAFSRAIQTSDNNTYLLRAALPREPICTENLTPIMKLLPTKGRVGISSLLDGHKLFDSKWVGTSIDVNTFDIDESNVYYKMVIDLNTVFDVPTVLNKIKRPLPKPIPGEELNCDYDKHYDSYHCFPVNDYSDELSFDFDKIFGKKVKIDKKIGTSEICANVNSDDHWELRGELSSMDKESGHLLFANTDLDSNNCFTLYNNPPKKEEFNLKFNLKNSYNKIQISNSAKPEIYVSRSITGYELDKGGFRIVFKNPTDHDLDLVYFESLPWYLRIYLNTLKISQKSDQQPINGPVLNKTDIIKNISYVTAIDRQRPTKLELWLRIPKNSVITFTYSFDKSLLLYSEYPPDANHGFELEPAVITLIDTFSNQSYYALRTAPLLVSLPTPDFSMPYNVIILTSTIMALVFGTVFNLLMKRVISEEEYEKLVASLPARKNLLQLLILTPINKVKNTIKSKSKKD